jgi:hypothetical protein
MYGALLPHFVNAFMALCLNTVITCAFI